MLALRPSRVEMTAAQNSVTRATEATDASPGTPKRMVDRIARELGNPPGSYERLIAARICRVLQIDPDQSDMPAPPRSTSADTTSDGQPAPE